MLGRLLTPIDLILHCPSCGRQHIDAADAKSGWDNPPHRSHLCANCGCVWRPADVPTNGVASIATRGRADSWRVGSLAPIDAITDDVALVAAKSAHDQSVQASNCDCSTTRPHLRASIEAAIHEVVHRRRGENAAAH